MDIKPIKTESDHEAALREIERLWGATYGSPEGDKLDVLVTLVEVYEQKHYPIPPPDPIEAWSYELACRLIQSIQNRFQLSTWTDEQMSSNSYWTTQLYCALNRLADDLEVEVRHSQVPPHSEFLYDVCFLETSGRNSEGFFTPETSLERVILVLESEWQKGSKGILYDFTKLLLARADLRAFVLALACNSFERILQDMKSVIKSFTQGSKSDRYLVCNLQDPLFVLLDGEGNELCRVDEL